MLLSIINIYIISANIIMASLNLNYSRTVPNPIYTIPTFVSDDDQRCVNCLIEIPKGTINKYEYLNDIGLLKLDRVGYSSLAYPFSYGAIPCTLDEDGDPLDVMVVYETEKFFPGCLIEGRVIGVMKMVDGEEVDDKILVVPNNDKRYDHINEINEIPEYLIKEFTYYWTHYKDMKKPGTVSIEGFLNSNDAVDVIMKSIERYEKEILPKLK